MLAAREGADPIAESGLECALQMTSRAQLGIEDAGATTTTLSLTGVLKSRVRA